MLEKPGHGCSGVAHLQVAGGAEGGNRKLPQPFGQNLTAADEVASIQPLEIQVLGLQQFGNIGAAELQGHTGGEGEGGGRDIAAAGLQGDAGALQLQFQEHIQLGDG